MWRPTDCRLTRQRSAVDISYPCAATRIVRMVASGLQRRGALPPSATTTLMPKSPDLKQLFTLPDTVPAATASTVIHGKNRVGGNPTTLGRLQIKGYTAICAGAAGHR